FVAQDSILRHDRMELSMIRAANLDTDQPASTVMRRSIVFSLIAIFAFSGTYRSQAQEPGLKLPPYKREVLPNGLTLLLMERHDLPLVSFQLIVKTGAVADPAGKEGLAAITAELLRKGTKARTGDKISEELDFVGATFGAGRNPDYSTASAEFVKKDVSSGLDLLADMIENADRER